MTPRERAEQLEVHSLGSHATLAINSRGRAQAEEPCDLRTDFCRDRDRIIHCKAFRRLKQKTQVFLSPQGDHYRTRLTHTLEVAQIARTIARAVGINEDLTEAIALGHDLGHTPFGHAGERALDELCPGGFQHYEQSVRVVDQLERERRGLNLTFETIDGIRNHTKGVWPATPEGCAVRHADRIAYLNHDIEDAVTAGVLCQSELPKNVVEQLGHTKSQRITVLVTALVEHFDGVFHIPDDIQSPYDELHAFMFEHIYLNVNGGAKAEEHKALDLIRFLYSYYTKSPARLPVFFLDIADRDGVERAVADYISGMSDEYAVHRFEELFIPKSWGIQAESSAE